MPLDSIAAFKSIADNAKGVAEGMGLDLGLEHHFKLLVGGLALGVLLFATAYAHQKNSR